MDTDYCRERFRRTGGAIYDVWLCDDGRTRLTTHGEFGGHKLCSWDMNAGKPLRWAIGVPAGLAAMLVLYTAWRARRRAIAGQAVSA